MKHVRSLFSGGAKKVEFALQERMKKRTTLKYCFMAFTYGDVHLWISSPESKVRTYIHVHVNALSQQNHKNHLKVYCTARHLSLSGDLSQEVQTGTTPTRDVLFLDVYKPYTKTMCQYR